MSWAEDVTVEFLKSLKSTIQYSQDVYQPVSSLALGQLCTGRGHFPLLYTTKGITDSSFALPRNFLYIHLLRETIRYHHHLSWISFLVEAHKGGELRQETKAAVVCGLTLKPQF